jgi:hypothetical protein
MHQRELHSTACSRNGTASCDGAGGGRYSSKLVGSLAVLESVAMGNLVREQSYHRKCIGLLGSEDDRKEKT